MKTRKEIAKKYYRKNRKEILAKLKSPEQKERLYRNERKYRKTVKGKEATHRAYINRIIKEAANA